ncbi:hypothetical protein [Halorarius litoreus]|uniref:hypothetical protein n=1 Tax=Halorarius litoreus TaxID=2962676 RepID=UPI0020CF3022|nr:hypothetical protein [Halorarius litoreus]
MFRCALLLVALLVLAGCVGGPGPVSSTATPDTAVASPTDATMAESSSTPRASARVHYVLDVGGAALDEFRSVNVTVRSVAFRDGTGSQCHGRLYPDDVTLTPTKTPDPDRGLDCLVFETERTLDLTDHREALSLGAYTVPAVVADDTFVVVTPHNGTLENGTQVQFAPDDPGFALEPTRDGDIRRVGIAVDRYRSGYGVGPGGVSTSEPAPAAAYTVEVEGAVRDGSPVTVSVARNGDPLREHPVTVDGRTEATRSDGSVTVDVETARVFEITVPVNASAA